MDIDAALKDGYSLQEVNQEAAKRVKFNYEQAIKDGYSDDDINQELRRRLKTSDKTKKGEDMKAPTYMGIPEAALSVLASTPAQIAGGVLGFGSVTGDLLKGKLPDMDKAANVVNDVIEHNFGLGQFKGVTDPGKRAIDATPEVMAWPGQFVGKNITGPIGGMTGGEKGALQGEILGQVGTDVGMNFLPIHATLKAPGKVVDAGVTVKNKFKAKPQPTPEITSKLDAIDAQEMAANAPPEVPSPEWRLEHPIAAETRVREQNRKQPTADDYNNRDANVRAVEEEIAAMDTYQRSVAQQREVQLQQESVANLQKLNELNPDGTYKNQTIIDDTPHGGPGKQFGMTDEFGRIDENGIPIRADLSMEAQNLQNPLQRNLWGDELPTRTGDGGIPLTEALDSMPPGPARTEAMNQLRGQRGAINLKTLEEGFEKFKTLPNGNRLWAFAEGDGQLNIIATNKDGEYIGGTRMSPEAYRNPTADDFMSSLSTDSFEKGMATEMYKFVSELGNDIVPSKAQSPKGKAMWDSFEKRGISANKLIQGQRGGIDVKAISEEVAKMGKKFSEVGKKAVNVFTPQEDVIRGIIKDNTLIPRGEAPEQIVAKALAEGKDGPPLMRMFQSGLSQAGDKVNSAVMKGVARHITTAEKIGDKAFRDNVKPLEQAFSSLSKKELADLVAMRIRAMNRRKAYTPEQLKEAGFTDRQIAVNKQLEDNYAAVLEADNAAREKLGLKPVTANQAYFASMWNGNYHIPVHDKNGSLTWYIKTESRGEASKAITWLKENQGDLIDTSKLKYDYRPEDPSGKIPRDIMGQYEAMLEVFKDTPVGAQIHELMQQQRTDQAYSGRNFDVHFEHKKNVRGFIGDRPWLTHEENGVMGAKAQIQYLKEANRWAPMQEAMAAVKEVVTNPELLAQQPNNMAMTKLYVDNAMGTTKNLFSGLEHVAGKAMGTSPGQMKKFVGTLKTLTYLKQLGFSTGYMVASVGQALVLGPARHQLLSQAGYKHNVLKSFADSMYDTASVLGQHWLDKDGKNIPISETGKEALRYMEDNGLIDVTLFDEYAQLGQHKGLDTAKQVVGLTISFPEKVTRVMTFMSFVHHLKNSGLSKAEMFRLAEEHTQSTLTNFHRSARPLIVDSMGMTGELAYTYKSPMFNFYNSLFEFAAHGKRTGNYASLASAVMMTGALGGIMNLPAMSELETGMQAVKNGVAKFLPNIYASWFKDVPTPKQLAMENLPAVATYGVVSQATGAQMASRFSNEVVDFENPMQGTMPAFSLVGDVAGSAADVALHGADKTSVAQATHNLGMPVTKGMTEAGNWLGQFKAGDTPLYYNPNKLRERDIQVERDSKDLFYRKLGLTSMKEATDKDALWLSRKETSRRDDAAKKLLEAAINKVVTEGNIQTEVENYIALGGDPTRLKNGLMRGIQDASMTPQDREVMRARTLNQINGVLRRQGMEQ